METLPVSVIFLLAIFQLCAAFFVPSGQILSRQASCNETTIWDQSYAQYEANGVTPRLREWWNGVSTTGRSFSNALGADFGDQVKGFMCGMEDMEHVSHRVVSVAYAAQPDTVWAYDARAAIVNMNYAFNTLHTGVTNGQLDFIGLIPNLIETFIPSQEQQFDPKLLGIWLTAGFGVLFAAFPPSRPLGAALAVLAGGFATISEKIEIIDNKLEKIDVFGQFASEHGEQTRDAIESWANEMFNGTRDSTGHDIIDYLPAYAEPVTYDFHDAEVFVKSSMIARTINEQWRNNTLSYVMCASSASFLSPTSTNNDSSTYFPGGNTICSFYTIDGNGDLTTAPGYNTLTTENKFGIQAKDITESSFGAYNAAKFDYNPDTLLRRIEESLDMPVADQPVTKGAAWEGIFNMPVCHVGPNVVWLVRNQASNTYSLPCCCGSGCSETKDFVAAARLIGNEGYLRKCQAQYSGFESVDYGFTFGGSKGPLSRNAIIGIAVGGGIFLLIMLWVLICCCRS